MCSVWCVCSIYEGVVWCIVCGSVCVTCGVSVVYMREWCVVMYGV